MIDELAQKRIVKRKAAKRDFNFLCLNRFCFRCFGFRFLCRLLRYFCRLLCTAGSQTQQRGQP